MSETLTSFGFERVPEAEKAPRVRAVFDRVARRYDVMNDLMSLGLHRVWKSIALDKLNPQPGERILDVAGGTGDLAIGLKARAEAAQARRGGRSADIIVCDINQEMMLEGKARPEAKGLGWTVADAEALPFPEGFADAMTVAFGVRNMTRPERALAEARRVLRPGGRFLCLEFSKPTHEALETLYDRWSFQAIPRIGRAVAGDADPYRYLVESIRQFPDQERFAAMVREAGFQRIQVTNLTGGIAAIHFGWRI